MIDGKQIPRKLVGSEDERAVSPVIGVILMVAITVILAAVIAAFVLDLGGSVSEEAQAGVSLEVDEDDEDVYVEVTSLGNADYVTLGGDAGDIDSDYDADPVEVDDDGQLEVGDTDTLDVDGETGTITAIAVLEEDDTATQVGSADYDF